MGTTTRARGPEGKLTLDGWEALRREIEDRDGESVLEICARYGVSSQRFYKRFPGGRRPGEPRGTLRGVAVLRVEIVRNAPKMVLLEWRPE